MFDIGEVLIDGTRVWSTWAEILGVSPLTISAVLGAAVVQGQDHEEVFPHVAPNCDWRDFVEEHERRYGGFGPEDLYADARPCLSELRELGFRIGIAGNQPARRREQLLALELPQDALTTSEDLGAAKPDGAFFDRLLELVGAAAEQVLYVGDRVDHDVLPAMDRGLPVCRVQRGPWGRLQAVPDGVPEPDVTLEGLAELPLLLQEWRDT